MEFKPTEIAFEADCLAPSIPRQDRKSQYYVIDAGLPNLETGSMFSQRIIESQLLEIRRDYVSGGIADVRFRLK